jgi:hypothetical protein
MNKTKGEEFLKGEQQPLMKLKRSAVLFLVMFMLMGVMLTGCRDRDNDTNSSTETNQTDLYRERDEFRRQMDDPNRPPPERNPDGTIG